MAFEFVNLYLSTILPPIIIGVIIWKTDRFKEPGHLLLASFLIGFAIALPLQLLIAITQDVIAPALNLNLYAKEPTVAEFAFMHFFRAAFLEEGLKFALLIFFCVRLADLNEPMDAIIYASAIGLGYATMENIDYLYIELAKCTDQNCWALDKVKDRYYPLVMHFGFAVVMGFFLSQSLFREQEVFKKRVSTILALLVPVVFHGSYNYLRAFDVFPVLTLVFIIGIFYYYRSEQGQRITEPMDKSNIEGINIFYSYIVSFLLVIIVVASAIITTARIS